MVESGRIPSRMERQTVWFRAQGISSTDWIEGIFISIRNRLFRKCQVRIAFVAPFPYEAFKTLVYGPNHSHEFNLDHVPDHEKDHFWS